LRASRAPAPRVDFGFVSFRLAPGFAKQVLFFFVLSVTLSGGRANKMATMNGMRVIPVPMHEDNYW